MVLEGLKFLSHPNPPKRNYFSFQSLTPSSHRLNIRGIAKLSSNYVNSIAHIKVFDILCIVAIQSLKMSWMIASA